MKKIICATIVSGLAVSSSATIINIPADYLTIQQGIDASSDGDTVLVQPQTGANDIICYEENINFYGKRIIVGSLFLTTNDEDYISETIIDGGNASHVVTFSNGENEESVLIGFTIQNGRDHYGGGIYCTNSSPTISNNIIKNNTVTYPGQWDGGRGGGIYCYFSNAMIYDNLIINNLAEGEQSFGGGIYCDESDATIQNNTIVNNTCAVAGGGLLSFGSNLDVVNNILWENYAPISPEMNNLSGNTTVSYCDVLGGYPGAGNIDIYPIFADPLAQNYSLCIQSPCIDAGDPDITDPDGTRSDIGIFTSEYVECLLGSVYYVSMTGNDSTGDGSIDNPFRTITHAINVSFYKDTIIVEQGFYQENLSININGNTQQSLVITSNYLFTGDSSDIVNTIIDGNSSTTVVSFTGDSDSLSMLSGFTIQNGLGDSYFEGGGIFCDGSSPTISHNIITGNIALYGGGIMCKENATPIISFNLIQNNTGNYGGGIYSIYSNPRVTNNIFQNNIANVRGGGVYCIYSDIYIRYNIITGNIAQEGGGIYCRNNSFAEIYQDVIINNYAELNGGGIHIDDCDIPIYNSTISRNIAEYGGGLYMAYSYPTITNTIMWADSAIYGNEIYIYYYGLPDITYSNIMGGWEGLGNLNINPLFRDPVSIDYHLMALVCGDSADSPCIDAGDPHNADWVRDCLHGYGDDRADMGAYGGGNIGWPTGIMDEYIIGNDILPDVVSLFQNYPNPFNAQTTIRFILPKSQNVELTIYDLLGRQVETLIDEYRQAGVHTVTFDASGLSSSVYFYRLQAGDKVENKRMVLLK